MNTPHRISLSVCAALAFLTSPALAQDDDFSRENLFFSMEALEEGSIQFALPPKFQFPDSARAGSSFGIDVSHYTEARCRCKISLAQLSSNRIDFVYAKATQGVTYTDPTFHRYLEESLGQKSIKFGAYHFLTATDDAEAQAQHFLAEVGSQTKFDRPPSLDLEWHPGPVSASCPSNAIITLPTAGGFSHKCDLWSSLSSDEIIGRANAWIDTVKAATGTTPLIYTNAAWWSSRIGAGSRIVELHSDMIWIADYSKGGHATEQPKVPGAGLWRLWQFTDRASLTVDGATLIFDATIEK